jgi:hypothetical protein
MSRQTAQETKVTNRSAEAPNVEPDHDQIETLAYQLWLERGCPDGSPQDDWFRAETQLKQPELMQRAASRAA